MTQDRLRLVAPAVHGTQIPGTEAVAARLDRSGHAHVPGDRCRLDLDLTGVSWSDGDTGLRIADS